MMSRFMQLFSLRVSHAYYTGACTDFDFVLPAESARALSRGRLLARVRDGVFFVLFEADETGTPRVPLGGAVVQVGLRLNNPLLHNFTDPAPPVAPAVSLYRNRMSPNALDAAETRTLVGNLVAHPLALATRPVTVTLKDDGEVALVSETITATADRSSVSFDLTGFAQGPLSIDEDDGAGGTARALYYRHPELQKEGVSAVVDVAVAAGFYTTPPELVIPLASRLETLRYYLIVSDSQSADFDKLNIADAGDADEPLPTLTFTRINDAVPAGLPPLVKARGLLFESDVPVPRRERGRKKIQLSRNGEVLIDHLPQPAPHKANADMILHISK